MATLPRIRAENLAKGMRFYHLGRLFVAEDVEITKRHVLIETDQRDLKLLRTSLVRPVAPPEPEPAPEPEPGTPGVTDDAVTAPIDPEP